jgi:hypothetical protein
MSWLPTPLLPPAADGVVATDLLLDTGHRMPSNGRELADLTMTRVTPERTPVRWRAYDAGNGALPRLVPRTLLIRLRVVIHGIWSATFWYSPWRVGCSWD